MSATCPRSAPSVDTTSRRSSRPWSLAMAESYPRCAAGYAARSPLRHTLGMVGTPFGAVVTSISGLREHYREPATTSVQKEVGHLDRHCRDFIAHATFAVLSTAGADGRCDVSPKGGPAGFAVVLDDHRLAIPDLIGNNRLDSLQNIVENPNIAALFLVPGLDETLRVNGKGYVVLDDDVLDACVVHDRRPKSAIGIDVEVAYIHCAKALRRG